MRLSYFSQYEGEIKTLKLKKNPLFNGLGHYEDVDNKLWDVKTIVGNNGNPYVCARPVDNSPYYSTDNDSNSYGFHQWLPYYIDIVKTK